jgi:hypothetical protein
MSKYLSARGPLVWAAAIALTVALIAPSLATEPAEGEKPPPPNPLIHKSIPAPGAKTHTVVIGERFKAGGFKSWVFGSDYRSLWNTPIEFPVLDLDEVGGGLTPLKTGGFGQSFSLHFMGKDGKRYTVRSIDKDPTKRLMKALKETFVEDVLQDQISALMPCAGLVVDPLMEATGILHAPHALVVIPDDPRLGEYREDYAGLIGTLQVHASEGPNDTPGFAGSVKVSGSEKLAEHLEKNPENRPDSRAFLKAKLMDFYINDKDRHFKQWRWARFPDGENYIWKPIPEDRDQAFIDLDGFAMWLARRALPRQIKFEKEYPSMLGLTASGWEIDREILSDLEWSVWEEVAMEMQRELTDEVIEGAVLRLPPPFYEQVGAFLEEALKARRDDLPEFARKYYKLISRDVEVLATDKKEYADFEHKDNGDLKLTIGRVKDGERKPPYYERTFHPDQTKEVRLYLRGGGDRAEILGGKGKITVRVDGGGGDDTFINSSQTGGGKTRFYDSKGDNTFEEGKGAKVDESKFRRPPAKLPNYKYAFDWGKNVITLPIVAASPDLGAYFGLISSREYYGYRKAPFKSRHMVNLGMATKGPEPMIAYDGTFRTLFGSLDGTLHLEYSGIHVIRFHGLGNDFEIPEDTEFYEVDQKEFIVHPALVYRAGQNHGEEAGSGIETLRSVFTASLGPIVRFADTPLDDNSDKFIGSFDSLGVYGTGEFGQVGAKMDLAFDTRDKPGFAKKGVLLTASGTVYPEGWDVDETFGHVSGAASTYLTAPIPTQPSLALRAGGMKVWGDYPFHEAAYLGGPGTLRGYRQNRFGGDAAVYGNAELRLELFPIKFLVPGKLGVFGAADAGQVFLEEDPDDADDWHSAVGGGVWLSFIDRMATLSVSIMDGDDLTGVYLQSGFMF